MGRSAHNTLKKIQKNPAWLEARIRAFFPRARVRAFSVLKDKYIIGNAYKITCLAVLRDAPVKSIILEIHDDADYFSRVEFFLTALKNLRPKEKNSVANLYRADRKQKIIFREDVPGKFLRAYLERVSLREKIRAVRQCAAWLSRLHNLAPSSFPRFLVRKKNMEIEKKILKKTLEFLKPNVALYRATIEKNLRKLLKKMREEKRLCLIHGDFQFSNICATGRRTTVVDYDTCELGNPGRDLGRFTLQAQALLPRKISSVLNAKFLTTYFSKSKFTRSELDKNIALHQAEMIQYILLGEMWGGKIPDASFIKKLLTHQSLLLKTL